MPRAEPLITPEELQCLLGGAPARANKPHKGVAFWGPHASTRHFGAVLWLVKGIFLYAVLMSPEAEPLVGSSPYLWMRGSLELFCLVVFGAAAWHPRGHALARACLLVASTSLLLDLMTLLAFTA